MALEIRLIPDAKINISMRSDDPRKDDSWLIVLDENQSPIFLQNVFFGEIRLLIDRLLERKYSREDFYELEFGTRYSTPCCKWTVEHAEWETILQRCQAKFTLYGLRNLCNIDLRR